MGKGVSMRTAKLSYLFMAIAIVVICACSGKLTLSPEFTINGSWITEFEATHYQTIAYPEDPDPSYTLTHTSTMRFDNGNFMITVNPPVPPFYDMWVTDSVWTGQYFIEGNELTLAADDISEVYTFEIAGDRLGLSLKIENHVDENGQTYVVMPIWGGLPWGRAMLCHGGSFKRDLQE